MLHIKAKQVVSWEREELERWFAATFPERTIGHTPDEVGDYLNSRASRAGELGFGRPSHLRFLIGYEIGCGVPWMDDAEVKGPAAPVVHVLLRRDLEPEARIEAAERLLYGENDD